MDHHKHAIFFVTFILTFSLNCIDGDHTQRIETLEKIVCKILNDIKKMKTQESEFGNKVKERFTVIEPTDVRGNASPSSIIYQKFPQQLPRSFQILLSFLENPRVFLDSSVKIPNKFLFYGPPGCGKSYLAELIANQFRLPMIYVKASDLEDSYYGESSKKITEIFKTRDSKGRPLLVFIDEIDAIASQRNEKMGDGRRATINALLVELQRCSYDSSIIVIVGTNDKESLDKAILSRFEGLCVKIEPMDPRSLKLFLEDLLKNIPVKDKDHAINVLTEKTKGLSRRAIETAISNAHAWSICQNRCDITVDDILPFISQTKTDVSISLSTKRLIHELLPYVNFSHLALGTVLTLVQLINHPAVMAQLSKAAFLYKN